MTNSKQNNACPHLRSRNAVNLLLFLVPTLRSSRISLQHNLPDSKSRRISMQLLSQGSSDSFSIRHSPLIGKDSSLISNPSGILRVNSVRDLSGTEPLPARRRKK